MYPDHTTSVEARQAGIAAIMSVPGILIGFYVGMAAAGIGAADDFGSVLLRGLVCASFPVILALFAPRYWLLPGILFGLSYYFGYTMLDGVGAAVGALVGKLMGIFTIQSASIGVSPEPKHPELPWIFVIAVWCAAFTALLRRHFSRKIDDSVKREGAQP